MSINYHGYDVLPKYETEVGGETIIKWETTGQGEYFIGTKGGKKYFVKRDTNVKRPELPPPGKSSKRYTRNYERYTRRLKKQGGIATALASLTLERDFIVKEDETIKDGPFIVTVTRFVDGCKDFDGANPASLPKAKMLEMFGLMAERVAKLHSLGVIDGDLKPTNFVYIPAGGGYNPVLLDFDTAFTFDYDLRPAEAPGTEGYRAPELIKYSQAEIDEGGFPSVPRKIVTSKVDVFSLAIIFHFILAGALPECGEYGSPGDALLDGKEIVISDKASTRLGDGSDFKDLLAKMLSADPKNRPNAVEVAQALGVSTSLAVPSDAGSASSIPAGGRTPTGSTAGGSTSSGSTSTGTSGGSTSGGSTSTGTSGGPIHTPRPPRDPELPFEASLWPEDAEKYVLTSYCHRGFHGLIGFAKTPESEGHLYKLTFSGGREKKVDGAGLVRELLASKRPTESAEALVFDEDACRAKGIASHSDLGGGYYLLVLTTGYKVKRSTADVLRLGIAHRGGDDGSKVVDDVPFPCDGSAYDQGRLKEKKVVKIEKIGVNASPDRRYKLTFEDGHTQELTGSNMIFFRYLIK